MTDFSAWLEGYRPFLSPRDLALLERAAGALAGSLAQPAPGAVQGGWHADAAWHALGAAHWDAQLARAQIRVVLEAQLPSGALPGMPPLLAWAAAWVDTTAPEDAFLAWAYPKFTAFEQYWRSSRCVEGLFHYASAGDDPALGREPCAGDLWPVDLNCVMVMLYRALAYLAWRLGRVGDKGRWEARAGHLAERINARLFDDQRGAYLAYDYRQGCFSSTLNPASFLPLYINIADARRAQSLAALAADPGCFFPGMPGPAYNEPARPGELDGPAVTRLDAAYFALKGLKDAGHREVAEQMRQVILGWVEQDAGLHERYDARAGQALGPSPSSRSAAALILFLVDWGA